MKKRKVNELTTIDEMKNKLLCYSKLIDPIDEYYYKIKKGSPEKNWIDDNWSDLCESLADHFFEMVDDWSQNYETESADHE